MGTSYVAAAWYAVERCVGKRGGGHNEFIACRAYIVMYLNAWSDEQASGLAGWKEEGSARQRSARM
jgi:hypothetical protein